MRKILWAFLVIIFLSAGTSSYACTCGGSTMIMKLQLMEGKLLNITDKAWLDEYPGVIFTGQVLKRKKVNVKLSGGVDWRYYQVTFKVDKYWKGSDSPEVVVFTGVGGGSCGIRFSKGESYIVFAEMIENRLETGICTFTADSRYIENIIKGLNLGDGRSPKTKSTKH